MVETSSGAGFSGIKSRMSSELSVVVAVGPPTAAELLLAIVSVEDEAATSSGAGFSGIKSGTELELSAAADVVLATASVEAELTFWETASVEATLTLCKTASVVVAALNLRQMGVN